MISALLADSLLRKNTRREPIMGVTFLLIVGAVLQGINWTNVSGDPIKVTLIQGNIAQKDKWQLENRNTTLKHPSNLHMLIRLNRTIKPTIISYIH
jgi:apolipoprotein N-acyltransferase